MVIVLCCSPGASEYFVGRDGLLEFNILLNGGVVRRSLGPGDAILVPQGSLHYFVNQNCQQAGDLAPIVLARLCAPALRRRSSTEVGWHSIR